MNLRYGCARTQGRGTPRKSISPEVRMDTRGRGIPSYGRLLPLGLVIVVVSALLLAAQPARADAARPTWSVGDYWEYDILVAISPSGEAGTPRLPLLPPASLSP